MYVYIKKNDYNMSVQVLNTNGYRDKHSRIQHADAWTTKTNNIIHYCYSITLVSFPRPSLLVDLLPSDTGANTTTTPSSTAQLGGILINATDLHPVINTNIKLVYSWGLV